MSSIQETLSIITQSLEKIYGYSSGFDSTASEYINAEVPIDIELGNKVFLFKPEDDHKKIVAPYEIVGFGKKLIKEGLLKKISIPTYSLESYKGEIVELTEPEFMAQAVSPKEYYNRLIDYTRRTELERIQNMLTDEIQKLELRLDKLYFDQECLVNDMKVMQARAAASSEAEIKKEDYVDWGN